MIMVMLMTTNILYNRRFFFLSRHKKKIFRSNFDFHVIIIIKEKLNSNFIYNINVCMNPIDSRHDIKNKFFFLQQKKKSLNTKKK